MAKAVGKPTIVGRDGAAPRPELVVDSIRMAPSLRYLSESLALSR